MTTGIKTWTHRTVVAESAFGASTLRTLVMWLLSRNSRRPLFTLVKPDLSESHKDVRFTPSLAGSSSLLAIPNLKETPRRTPPASVFHILTKILEGPIQSCSDVPVASLPIPS